MKIGTFDVPDKWLYLAISFIAFSLGIAVGVKATLTNIEAKIKAAAAAHQDPTEFQKAIYAMFIGTPAPQSHDPNQPTAQPADPDGRPTPADDPTGPPPAAVPETKMGVLLSHTDPYTPGASVILQTQAAQNGHADVYSLHLSPDLQNDVAKWVNAGIRVAVRGTPRWDPHSYMSLDVEDVKEAAAGDPPPHLPNPPTPNCQCGCTKTGKCTCKDCDHPKGERVGPEWVRPQLTP